jgi:hypothetical protein
MAVKKSKPTKTEPRMDAERVRMAIMENASSIGSISPQRLASYLEAFRAGYLRDAAIAWQRVRENDDQVVTVTEKRELAASLLNYEILTLEDSPAANQHKEALEEFYNNLTTTHALDMNQRGGVATLIKQMMHAVGHKYAVHEIVWRPGLGEMRAEFRFVPLQYFENTTGRLRYLASGHFASGEDLEEAGWMVTTGPGLMNATSIAACLKQHPLRAWLILCDKFAVPYLHGETQAAYGSKEWKDFRDALAAFVSDGAVVTSPGTKITPVTVNGVEAPSAALIERMDRAIARMWRGADLGTMSQDGSAVGSNPQESETDILEAADAMIISETLQHYVDAHVIRYRFGTEPLAYFQLQPKVKINQELQLKIDDYLIKWGVPRGKKALLQQYGRPEPDPTDELASAPITPSPFGAPGGSPFGNEQLPPADAPFQAASLAKLKPAERAVMEPVLRRLVQIARMPDATAQRGALERFRAALPEVGRGVIAQVPALAAVWEQVLSPAAIDGWINAAKAKKTA